MFLLFCCTAEAAVADSRCVVVNRDSVLNENSLSKACALFDFNGFILVGVICYLNENVPLVVRIKIVAVDYTDGVVELEAELESETAPRVNFQNPALVDFASDTRRNFCCLGRSKREIIRCKNMLACRACRCTCGQLNLGVHLLYFTFAEIVLTAFKKLFIANLVKFCDSFHIYPFLYQLFNIALAR